MIIHDVIQGSPEWITLRLGMPTASQFHRIITPRTGKPSSQADGYLRELLVEWALGVPADSTDSQWMQRGREQEDAALAWYEFTRDVQVIPAGFVTIDRGDIGCSPDGLVGTGGIEVKTLSAKNHVGALLGDTDDGYHAQVQGCMWITERSWWDRIWWHHLLPPVVVRVERDEEFIAKLDSAVDNFCTNLEAAKQRLLDAGVSPRLESKRAMARDLAEFDRLSKEQANV